MPRPLQASMAGTKPDIVLEGRPGSGIPTDGASINFYNKSILLGGKISTRAQAEELVATLNALKPLLKENGEKGTTTASESDGSDTKEGR